MLVNRQLSSPDSREIDICISYRIFRSGEVRLICLIWKSSHADFSKIHNFANENPRIDDVYVRETSPGVNVGLTDDLITPVYSSELGNNFPIDHR